MNLLETLTTIGKPRITVNFYKATAEEVTAITTLLGEGEKHTGNHYDWLQWNIDNIEITAWTR
jgi:hypothetical protein